MTATTPRAALGTSARPVLVYALITILGAAASLGVVPLLSAHGSDPLASLGDVVIARRQKQRTGGAGGGAGGGVPSTTPITHLPRCTGDVRSATDVSARIAPLPSSPRR